MNIVTLVTIDSNGIPDSSQSWTGKYAWIHAQNAFADYVKAVSKGKFDNEDIWDALDDSVFELPNGSKAFITSGKVRSGRRKVLFFDAKPAKKTVRKKKKRSGLRAA